MVLLADSCPLQTHALANHAIWIRIAGHGLEAVELWSRLLHGFDHEVRLGSDLRKRRLLCQVPTPAVELSAAHLALLHLLAIARDLRVERGSGDVEVAAILDRNQILAWLASHVGELVAVIMFVAIQLHLAGAIDGHRQGTASGLHGVDEELVFLTDLATDQALARRVHHAGIGILKADYDAVRTAGHLLAVLTDVDKVGAVLFRDETDRELVVLDRLHDARLLSTRGRHNDRLEGSLTGFGVHRDGRRPTDLRRGEEEGEEGEEGGEGRKGETV